MIRLNIHEAKTHLSRYLNELEQGKRIILCRRNVPVAEIRLLKPEKVAKPRPIGLHDGRFEVPPSFFEPLPSDLLRAFGGEDE